MEVTKRYEILDALPTYGPMYIPVTINDQPYYSEGFPVRFYKTDGTDWVANFKPGLNGVSKVFNFKEHNKIIVIAGGLGYIMTPENHKPLSTFGLAINDIFQTDNGSLICADGLYIIVLDNLTGELWESDRISWDGFQNLVLHDEIITGQSYEPTSSMKQWIEFSLNIVTKELTGGSYPNFEKHNPDYFGVKRSIENISRQWW